MEKTRYGVQTVNRKTGICYIVGAGDHYGAEFTSCAEDYVIAADAGLQVLEQKRMHVDLAVGDFDSLGFVPKHARVLVLPKEKDDTDMRAAVNAGIEAGYHTFHIYGGTGGRVDHTIANMQLLAELSLNGKRGFLFGRDYIMTALTNGVLTFPEHASGYVSVFAHSNRAEGVWLRGLKYELRNATLSNSYPLGVSNEFAGNESSISVKNGTLLIVFPLEAKEAAYL